MAVRHWDGFTAYTVVADLDHLYTRAGGGASTNIAIVPGGGPSAQGAVRFGGVNALPAYIYRPFTAAATIFTGFKLRCLEWNSSAADLIDHFIAFGDTGSVEMSLVLNSDYSLSIYSGGSDELFRSSITSQTYDGQAHYLTPGVDYVVEFGFVIGDDGSFELIVNGEVWANASADTYNFSADCNRISVGVAAGLTGGGAHFEISELYVLDDTGTSANAFLGSWEAQILRPDADSAASDFAPSTGSDNYAMVDEGQHDQDGTYNSSATTNHIDRFTTGDSIVGDVAKVIAANVVVIARHDGTSTNMRTKLRHSGSDQNGSSVAANAEDYRPRITLSTVNPSTSAMWTPAEIEAAEFGYEEL